MKLLKYALKFFFRYIHYILFIISISLSLMILLPLLLQHSATIFGIDSPKILIVKGFVFAKKNNINLEPIKGCSLEIGGYKSITDKDGMFRIKFLSKTTIEIPIVIKILQHEEIKRISFPPNVYETEEVLILK